MAVKMILSSLNHQSLSRNRRPKPLNRSIRTFSTKRSPWMTPTLSPRRRNPKRWTWKRRRTVRRSLVCSRTFASLINHWSVFDPKRWNNWFNRCSTMKKISTISSRSTVGKTIHSADMHRSFSRSNDHLDEDHHLGSTTSATHSW